MSQAGTGQSLLAVTFDCPVVTGSGQSLLVITLTARHLYGVIIAADAV